MSGSKLTVWACLSWDPSDRQWTVTREPGRWALCLGRLALGVSLVDDQAGPDHYGDPDAPAEHYYRDDGGGGTVFTFKPKYEA